MQELMDLDRQIQNKDEEILERRALLKEAQEQREAMVAALRAKIRTAYDPMPLLPFDGTPAAPPDAA
jgi:hypothetical protein